MSQENSEENLDSIEQKEIGEQEAVDELTQAQNELSDFKDKYLRMHADFENTKKRLEKDKITAVSYANSSFAKDLLSVMDSFDGAIASIDVVEQGVESDILEKIKDGIVRTHEQLKKVLEKHGICEIECEGILDPNVHQAIMQVEHEDKTSGEIAQVLQKGYIMKEQVLRPAMVATVK